MSSEPKSPPDPVEIPKPTGSVSTKPDSYTKKSPDFAASGEAESRVFHFQACGIRYGTDDKGHAAALILSVLILVAMLICVAIGTFFDEREWMPDVLKTLGAAFLIVAGVAIGKSIENKEE